MTPCPRILELLAIRDQLAPLLNANPLSSRIRAAYNAADAALLEAMGA